MRNETKACASRQEYASPELERVEFTIERGFADSIEIIGKDEEVDAF